MIRRSRPWMAVQAAGTLLYAVLLPGRRRAAVRRDVCRHADLIVGRDGDQP